MSHKDETPQGAMADNDAAFYECGFRKWEHGGYYGISCPKREGVFTMKREVEAPATVVSASPSLPMVDQSDRAWPCPECAKRNNPECLHKYHTEAAAQPVAAAPPAKAEHVCHLTGYRVCEGYLTDFCPACLTDRGEAHPTDCYCVECKPGIAPKGGK